MSVGAAYAQGNVLVRFDVKAQSLDDALNSIAKQSGIPLLFPFDEVQKLETKALLGTYTINYALEYVLKGTGLQVLETGDGIVTIVATKSPLQGETEPVNIKTKNAILSAASIGAIAIATPAVAQTPAPQDAEPVRTANSAFDDEIIVTAQKRQQNIQDVGVAVTAFNGEQLKAARLTNAADVVAQVPNVIARRHFPSRGLTTNLFVRGIGQTDFNDATESSVAPFVDDFYLIQASQADFATFDVERVEVLRGPQGTIFGRNATGGAVQSVTNRPQFDAFSGEIEVGFGNFNSRLVDGHVNVPLSEDIAFRFSATSDTHEPFVENLFPEQPDILDQNFSAARAQLRIAPSDALDVNLKYERGLSKGRLLGDQAAIFQGTADGDVIQVEENGAGFNPVEEGVDGPKITSEDGLNDARNEIDHLLGTIKYDFGNVQFTSITGWLNQNFELFEDCDSTPNPTCSFSPLVESEHWSQEFRLNGQADRLNWTLGAFYLEQDASNDVVLPIFLDAGDAAAGVLPSILTVDIEWDLQVQSLAGFGQLEYELTDKITLIGGLRLNYDKKEFEQLREFVGSTLPVGTTNLSRMELFRLFDTDPSVETSRVVQHDFRASAVGDLTEQSDTNFSGTLQIDYRPTDDLLLYTSFRRGLKSAGFNNGLVDVRQDQIELIPYDQEVLHAYEAGWKWDFGDERLGRLNGAVFYYDYQDFQAVSYVGIGNLTSNNDATVFGAELEFQASPAEGWFINAGAGFLFDTNVEDVNRVSFTDPTQIFTADRELAEAPTFSGNILVRKDWYALGGDWGAQIDANYTGERFTDVLNQSALVLDDYINSNANLSYRHEETDVEIRLWMRNLFDKQVATNELAAPGLDLLGQLNFNEPRTYGITFGKRW